MTHPTDNSWRQNFVEIRWAFCFCHNTNQLPYFQLWTFGQYHSTVVNTVKEIETTESMGVEKETIKEGDGTNFPKKGDELTMVSLGVMTQSTQATLLGGTSPFSQAFP